MRLSSIDRLVLPRNKVCLQLLVNVLINKADLVGRRLSIEEVSVLFDTGRLGDARAATAEFQADDDKHSVDGREIENVDDKGVESQMAGKDIAD